MISKQRLYTKLNEIKHHMKENPLLTERLIDSTKQMIENSEDKGLVQKIQRLCVECVKDGYSIGTNEMKGNRRNVLDNFLRKQTPRLEKRIQKML